MAAKNKSATKDREQAPSELNSAARQDAGRAKSPLRDARSLADLFRIRADPMVRAYLETIDGKLGTAFGFKQSNDGTTILRDPAIIVFVPQKVDRKWLGKSQRIRQVLSTPGIKGEQGIRCPVDVVEGGATESLRSIRPSQHELVKRLRGGDHQLWCGSQLASLDHLNREWFGTLGAFARRKRDGIIGFLTNDHVALGDRMVIHPNHASGGIGVGFRLGSFLNQTNPSEWYGPFAADTTVADARVHVDCEFLGLELSLSEDDFRPELPNVGRLGDVMQIDLNADMDSGDSPLIGQRVMKIGRTTGLTRGTVAAFAYEWKDQWNRSRYTDLLIAPDQVTLHGRRMSVPFSRTGDSGSMVVLENGLKPLGLVWGGFLEKLRGGRVQESWTYATRLDQILQTLQLELIR